jgi:hypothetical protein
VKENILRLHYMIFLIKQPDTGHFGLNMSTRAVPMQAKLFGILASISINGT